jgi:hypothetical protein
MSDELHRRLSNFVEWIAPESDREDQLRQRRKSICDSIGAKAQDDALVVRSTPASGSFATRTGLRRHMRGKSEVEGQDVDVPFVVSPKTKDEERLETLLPRFEKYARESYPDTERETTKSSVRLKFPDQVNYDLVPMFATKDAERQTIVRSDGERRETSVQKHADFVNARTHKSKAAPGRVAFNDMVRLLKWWRCFREAEARTIKDMPSFLVNLLAAHAFDHRGVRPAYGETIADWFGFLARVVRKRENVFFEDFTPAPGAGPGEKWAVYDPVNADNNVVDKWSGVMCDELADWLEDSRDAMYEAIAAFDDERESDGIECLVRTFGAPIRHHSDAEEG